MKSNVISHRDSVEVQSGWMKVPASSWTTSQRAPTNQRTNESELEQELEVGGECASGERHGYISYIASTANLYPRLSDSVPDIAETALGERSVFHKSQIRCIIADAE